MAGFLFAFAVVVMPGIRSLDDGEFIGAFRAIDGVIQRNQPLFMFVWVGSVLLLVAAALAGVWTLAGVSRLLVIAAALIYTVGVQAPTGRINIPLNNQLQRIDPGMMSETPDGVRGMISSGDGTNGTSSGPCARVSYRVCWSFSSSGCETRGFPRSI